MEEKKYRADQIEPGWTIYYDNMEPALVVMVLETETVDAERRMYLQLKGIDLPLILPKDYEVLATKPTTGEDQG